MKLRKQNCMLLEVGEGSRCTLSWNEPKAHKSNFLYDRIVEKQGRIETFLPHLVHDLIQKAWKGLRVYVYFGQFQEDRDPCLIIDFTHIKNVKTPELITLQHLEQGNLEAKITLSAPNSDFWDIKGRLVHEIQVAARRILGTPYRIQM